MIEAIAKRASVRKFTDEPVTEDEVRTMLRAGEEVFLDDTTLEQVTSALGMPVIPVDRPGDALVDALTEFSEG